MILYLSDNRFHYELENITRLFFWKVEVRNELPAAFPPENSCCVSMKENGDVLRLSVSAVADGKKAHESEDIPAGTPEKETEHECSVLLFRCLSGITGKRPAFGVMTGVRPAKYTANLLASGLTPEQTERFLQEHALVSPKKARLVRQTAEAGRTMWAKARPRGFSLYVSVPFCPTRCSYCSFVSKSTEKERKLIAPYLEALGRELEETARITKDLGMPLQTVYIGGGTPTVLTAEELRILTEKVTSCFGRSLDGEYSVESGRPDTMDREKLQVLKDAGVTRICINPQTGNDEVLRRVGRRHTAADIEACYRMARDLGFNNINADFIAGLPGDDLESFRRSMDWAIHVLDPESITVHALTLKRASRMRESQEEIFSPDAAAMVDHAEEVLTAAGFLPYYMYRQKGTVDSLENTGYAKPGFECLYNTFIMDEVQSIIACGAGSVTKLLDPATDRIERIFDMKYPQEYLDRFDEMLSRKQTIREFYEENGI